MGNPDSKISEVVGDVIYVPCRDDYESLLLKLVLGYEFLYRNMDFSYVYKIDDDCFPNLEVLTSKIICQLPGKQYAGGAIHPKGAKMNDQWHFGKCGDVRFDKPYHVNSASFDFAKGGYGYFLRKDILPIVFFNANNFSKELEEFRYSYEDVRISEILGARKIMANKLSDYCVVHGDKADSIKEMLVYDIKSPKKFDELLGTIKSPGKSS
jgi:hypothetical protein